MTTLTSSAETATDEEFDETTDLPTTTNYADNSMVHEDDVESEEVIQTDGEHEESIEHHGSTQYEEYYEEIDNNKTSGRSADIIIQDEHASIARRQLYLFVILAG